MSRPRSNYVVSKRSTFHFHHFHYDYSYEHAHTCSSAYFSEYVLLFLDHNVDEGCE